MPNIAKLKVIFEDIRALVNRLDNVFDYSGWDDTTEANTELDHIIQALAEGRIPTSGMGVLFLPTGPLQELSISSGWGDEFLEIANRFDRAMDEKDGKPCRCQGGARPQLTIVEDFGMDRRYAQVTIEKCRECGSLWLQYLYEHEAISGSGRWYRGEITAEQQQSITADNAKSVLESLPSYFYGGSYYFDTIARSSGPIQL